MIAFMEDAERLLEPPLSQSVKYSLSRFYDHVEREELERAWDELAQAGAAADANPMFWKNLAEAATVLGLEERRAEALSHARSAAL